MKELTHEEKSETIKGRYKTIRQEKKKRGLKDLKLDRLTHDRVQRKIMRSSTKELAEIGFNALIDEACEVNSKEELRK